MDRPDYVYEDGSIDLDMIVEKGIPFSTASDEARKWATERRSFPPVTSQEAASRTKNAIASKPVEEIDKELAWVYAKIKEAASKGSWNVCIDAINLHDIHLQRLYGLGFKDQQFIM